MKSFGTAYSISREDARQAKAAVTEQERATLVAAIKRQYGIDSFSALNESERRSYRSMLLEMWDAKGGMNDKGRKFLNESAPVLTKDSTEAQVKKAFQDKGRGNAKAYAKCILSSEDGSCPISSKHKGRIESQTGRRLSGAKVKAWICEILAKYVNSIKL